MYLDQGTLTMGAISLRRYTNLAAAIHLLRNRCLTLLNPASWDDRNDAYFLAQYKERLAASAVLALCFAEAPETYHHWRVFSSGGDGVCIEFDKPRLLEAIARDRALVARPVTYKQIKDLGDGPIDTDELPFLKRFPYGDEQEFRVIYSSTDKEAEIHHVPIPLASINRLTLSPWMHAALAKAVKDTLKQIEGCKSVKICQSTLVDNDRWRKAANPELDVRGA